MKNAEDNKGVAMNKVGKQVVRGVVAVAAVAAFGVAHAQQVSTAGYFRAGIGSGSNDKARECYGLDGAGLKYRLGNECDIYGELNIKTAFDTGGIQYSLNIMPTLFSPGTDIGDATWKLGQMFVEGKGFDIAPEASFWAGKRFYGRNDVHIVDTKFTQQDGVGAGVSGFKAGPGSVSVALFREDGNGTTPASRLNVEYGELPVNQGGKLRLVSAFTKGNYTGGTSGEAFTIEHTQTDALGLGGLNTVWLQYAQGSANLNTGFGNTAAGSDVKGYRLTDALSWQVGRFGGQAFAMISHNRADSGDINGASVGGRISYAFTKNLKWLAELGHSELKPEDGDTQKLTKLTLAAALSPAPTFWSRPELRVFVTTAKWNSAAAANVANGLPEGKTKGTTIGAQAEVWW